MKRLSQQKARFDIYRAEVEQKTGEIFLAIEADAWRQTKTASKNPNTDRQMAQQTRLGTKR